MIFRKLSFSRQFVRVMTLLILASAMNSHAETEVTQQATVLNKLASPKDESPLGTAINNGTIGDFLTVIPPEFVPVVQSGEISLTAFRSLRVANAFFDEQWKKTSAEYIENQEPIETLAQKGFPRGFPYPPVQDQQLDSGAKKAQQVLWNTQAHSAAFASYTTSFSFVEFGSAQGISLRGDIERVMPQRFRADDHTGQLFRERFRVLSPEPLKGMAWLTFRFFDSQDDVVWAYSPAIKKTRQLMSANRADGFLGSALALDDIWGFSGKVQAFEGAALSEGTYLAPFFSLDALPLRPDEPQCFVAELERKERTSSSVIPSVVGGDSRGEQTAIALRDMNFVPRKLLKLEMLQGDPYSNYGRYVVYVDAELFLPFYIFSYDRLGALAKVVVNSYTLTVAPPGQLRVWIPMTTVVKDVAQKSIAALSYDRIRFCEKADTTVNLSAFEPKGLNAPVEAPVVATTSVKPTAKPDFNVTLKAPH